MELQRLKEDIRQFIQNYTIDQGTPQPQSPKAIEADLLWDASRFWATVIHKATALRDKITYPEFLEFKAQYEKQNATIIDGHSLFDRFWLRDVLGFVEMPHGINSLLRGTFEEILKAREVFDFLDYAYSSLPPDGDKHIDKDQLSLMIAQYNPLHSTQISVDTIFELKMFDTKGDLIKLDNFHIYYTPILAHWEDFSFLFELYEFSRSPKEGLNILESEFEIIHTHFSKFFPVPAIEIFIEQKVVSVIAEDTYQLNFRNTSVDYRDLWDRITGYYWEIVINDTLFKSDQERILSALPKMLCWELYPNALLHCSEKARIRFLDAACILIEQERDLDDFDNESKKARIDDHHYGANAVLADKFFEEDLLDNSDLYELYQDLSRPHVISDNYPYDQRTRNWIFFLLWIIVKNDLEGECTTNSNGEDEQVEIFYFKRLTRLLSISKDRPALLSMMVVDIVHHRREIMPYLLTNAEFIPLSFQIIDQFHFISEDHELLSHKLWTKCLQLSLPTITRQDKDIAAKLIFQIFRQLTINKYHRNNVRGLNPHRKTDNIRERELLDIIEKCPTRFNSYTSSRGDDDFLLPTILEKIAQYFIEYQDDNIYNGCVLLPLVQLDGLSWAMRCSTLWRYNEQLSKNGFKTQQIASAFYSIYAEWMEKETVKKWDVVNQRAETVIPIWAEKCERTKVIDWLYPTWFIYKNRLLNKFLEPTINFNCAEHIFDSQNRYAASRLRSHVAILLQIHKTLVLPTAPYGLDKDVVGKIKRRVEEKIIDILEDNSQNDLKEGKIDIFDFNKEWGFGSTPEEALLPQIAKAVNYFHNREALIDVVLKSNNLLKILTFADLISSEKIREELIEKVKHIDVHSFLQNSHWIPEIESAILKLSQHQELVPQIEQVLEYWETEIVGKRPKHNEYKGLVYRTRLLLAYYRGDISELSCIQPPAEGSGILVQPDTPTYVDTKEFYRALILMPENPQAAYSIFNNLTIRYPKNIHIALNRMAAKMSMAKQGNIVDYYTEALEEWTEYITLSNPRINENDLGVTFLANKMLIYFETQRYDELKMMYSNLDPLHKMDAKILKLQIDTLNKLGESIEATLLTKQAENFHKTSLTGQAGEIGEIGKTIDTSGELAMLQSHYLKIFSHAAHNLIKIFPEKVNGKYDLNEFLVNELALAASRMLEKIMSISDIRHEDKYNDIIELALQSRIAAWGWSVKSQQRGGFSGTSAPQQPGERDLLITDAENPVCLCEAFIFRDTATAKAHVQKIFNYCHQHKNLIILIYNLTGSHFEHNWSVYQIDIVPNCIYPDGRTFRSVADKTKYFGYENSAIKIACSTHENDVTIHHILVNIDYRNYSPTSQS